MVTETMTQVEGLQITVEDSTIAGTITGTIVAGSESLDMSVSESAEMNELDDSELDVSGGGGRLATAHFDRHRSQTKATTFAGPDGAGSTFSQQEESISTGTSDLSWD
jgi:hypothetical protein